MYLDKRQRGFISAASLAFAIEGFYWVSREFFSCRLRSVPGFVRNFGESERQRGC